MKIEKRPVNLLASFRLFILFVAVAFSFGGFTFYAAVVVPIGGDVFDVTAQGFVTRRVTHFINAASGLTLALFVWEGIAARHVRRRWENVFFLGLASLVGACLAGLVVLHPQLDQLLSEQDFAVAEPERFYELHRVYLWVSTVQWLATLGIIWLICSAKNQPAAALESKL